MTQKPSVDYKGNLQTMLKLAKKIVSAICAVMIALSKYSVKLWEYIKAKVAT